jgi:hypothetical protein
MTKPECANLPIRHSDFDVRSSFEFRHSTFPAAIRFRKVFPPTRPAVYNWESREPGSFRNTLVNTLLTSLLAVAVLVAGVSPPTMLGTCAVAAEGETACGPTTVGACCGCQGSCCRSEPEQRPEPSSLNRDHRDRDAGIQWRPAGECLSRTASAFHDCHGCDGREAALRPTPVEQHVRIQT